MRALLFGKYFFGFSVRGKVFFLGRLEIPSSADPSVGLSSPPQGPVLTFLQLFVKQLGVLGRSGFLGIWVVLLSLFGHFVNLLTLKSVSPVFVLILKIHSFSVCLKISAKFLPFYYATSWIFTQEI